MKRFSLLLLLIVFLPQLAFGADEKPNIVFILADDQSWFDFGFLGSKEVSTPNLDRLADESAVFTRAYVPTSLCVPSLGTIVTGCYPHEHRMGVGLTGIRPTPAIVREQFERCPPLPRLLAEAGYKSLQTGKWWERGYETAGFTHGMTEETPVTGSHFKTRPDQTGPKQVTNLEKGILFLGGGEGLRIGRETFEPIETFIDENGDEPFFIWYAPMMPHTPHTPPKRLYDKYKSPDRTESQILYMAMCEWFDETVGDLIRILEEKGERENTLIAFVVDNGFIPMPNQPGVLHPRSKTSPYDAGVRTPLILNWPGKIKPRRYDDVAHTIDLVPTALAAAGLEIPSHLLGLNLLEVTDGKPMERDTVFGANFRRRAEKPKSPADTYDFRWCVQWPWKLILPYEGSGSPAELYNLDDDPRETKNLADKHPERVEALIKKINDWWPADESA